MMDKLEQAFCNKCGFIGVPDSMGFHPRPSDGEQCSYICRRTANLEIPTIAQATRWLVKFSDPDEVASTTPRKIANELADICALLITLPTSENGEQVERAFRAGWEQACITVDPCNGFHEEDYTEARSEILATLPTPTEDARERVKVLEEALRRMVYEATHLSPCKSNGDHDCTIKADALAQARTALGNKETDRHG